MLAGTIERTIIAGKKTEVYLPLGQWILREGLTEVTEGDLEERMDVDALCSVKCELFDVQDSKGGKHEVPSSG